MKSYTHRTSILLVICAALLLALVAGCSSAKSDAGTTTETTSGSTQATQTQESEGAFMATYEPNGKEIAVITTPKGVIKFEFYADKAPNHVASFVELAQSGFYNGTTFHRVEPGFVVQGGDPYSKNGEGPVGTGGPGYNIPSEFNDIKHVEGTVAMARSSDPNSAGSQFYICLAPAPFLDGQYTVFGQVIEGMDIVKKIAVGDVMESVVIENANQ